jgi:hypothetical protein
MAKIENEKIFVRRIKRGYLATYNGVKGKAKEMFKAIERAQKNYLNSQKENNSIVNVFERGTEYDLTRSTN